MDQKGKLQKPIILLLAMLLALMPAVLASCESGSNDFAEAETEVSSELEALKSGNVEVPQVADSTEGVSETMLSVYAEKLRDFDYMIAGSGYSKDGKSVVVTVNITTYDFGSVYLETWNDRMKVEEGLRSDAQFYTDLFTRFASLSAKNYTGQAAIVCTKGEDGEWTTDVKTNQGLINAISGGLVEEMTDLAEQSAEGTEEGSGDQTNEEHADGSTEEPAEGAAETAAE